MRREGLLALGVGLALMAGDAHAGLTGGGDETRARQLVDQARGERARGQHALAAEFLTRAEKLSAAPRGLVLHERGLLERDLGNLEGARSLLAQAADEDPSSPARVDLAAVLVQQGRKAEAVNTLRQALEERGAELDVELLAQDARFKDLATDRLFERLLEYTRIERAGPLGRLQIRVEGVAGAARRARDILEGYARVAAMIGRGLDAIGGAVVALLLLALALSLGVNQMGLLRPPWPLLFGMVTASILWLVAAGVAAETWRAGLRTVGVGWLALAVPWALGWSLRFALRRTVVARHRAADPFARPHLAHTLARLDQVSRLGHLLLETPEAEDAAVARDLRHAVKALHSRIRTRDAQPSSTSGG